MQLEHRVSAPVVLVGGSGVIGRELVSLLAGDERPPLILVGRDAARAQPALAAYRARGGEATFQAVDLSRPRQDLRIEARAVVTLVNDPSDLVLEAAVAGRVPYVDISRWTTRVATAAVRLSTMQVESPVVFSSAWMGGLAPRVASALAMPDDPLDSVDIAVRYAAHDSSGEDSVEFIDRLATPFEVMQDGRPVTVMPLSDVRVVDIGGAKTTVGRIDTPEQATLPITLGARTVGLRIGFDDPWATFGMRMLVRLGIFCAFSGERFNGFRRSLLRSSDADRRPGQETRFRVDVRLASGLERSALIVDGRGQAHLTAVGALLSLRSVLAEGARPGVQYPEQDLRNRGILETLAGFGVGVDLGTVEAPARAA